MCGQIRFDLTERNTIFYLSLIWMDYHYRKGFTKQLHSRGNGWRQNLHSAIQNTNYINWIKPDIEGINLEL